MARPVETALGEALPVKSHKAKHTRPAVALGLPQRNSSSTRPGPEHPSRLGRSCRIETAAESAACWRNDPEPGVPRDVGPKAQCAFDGSVLRISAVRTNYRI